MACRAVPATGAEAGPGCSARRGGGGRGQTTTQADGGACTFPVWAGATPAGKHSRPIPGGQKDPTGRARTYPFEKTRSYWTHFVEIFEKRWSAPKARPRLRRLVFVI